MQKQFYTQNNIGKAKYTISHHNGTDTHKDGGAFFGISLFKNKRKFEREQKRLIKEGYILTN